MKKIVILLVFLIIFLAGCTSTKNKVLTGDVVLQDNIDKAGLGEAVNLMSDLIETAEKTNLEEFGGIVTQNPYPDSPTI